ncbi:hypothetical protein GJ496_011980 [Pomphorhynchus laevis]|nr:hypothetical protein GJ496_011980 [Pomphorhynchus laevis]
MKRIKFQRNKIMKKQISKSETVMNLDDCLNNLEFSLNMMVNIIEQKLIVVSKYKSSNEQSTLTDVCTKQSVAIVKQNERDSAGFNYNFSNAVMHEDRVQIFDLLKKTNQKRLDEYKLTDLLSDKDKICCDKNEEISAAKRLDNYGKIKNTKKLKFFSIFQQLFDAILRNI